MFIHFLPRAFKMRIIFLFLKQNITLLVLKRTSAMSSSFKHPQLIYSSTRSIFVVIVLRKLTQKAWLFIRQKCFLSCLSASNTDLYFMRVCVHTHTFDQVNHVCKITSSMHNEQGKRIKQFGFTDWSVYFPDRLFYVYNKSSLQELNKLSTDVSMSLNLNDISRLLSYVL